MTEWRLARLRPTLQLCTDGLYDCTWPGTHGSPSEDPLHAEVASTVPCTGHARDGLGVAFVALSPGRLSAFNKGYATHAEQLAWTRDPRTYSLALQAAWLA